MGLSLSLPCPVFCFCFLKAERLPHSYWTLLEAFQNLKYITGFRVSRRNPEVKTVQLPGHFINPGSGLCHWFSIKPPSFTTTNLLLWGALQSVSERIFFCSVYSALHKGCPLSCTALRTATRCWVPHTSTHIQKSLGAFPLLLDSSVSQMLMAQEIMGSFVGQLC